MSIRNLTEEGNGITLRCLNSEISSGWYIPPTTVAAETTVTNFVTNDFYYQIRENVVHISGRFSCDTTSPVVAVTFPLPEGLELPDNRWNGVGSAISSNLVNNSFGNLYLFDVERVADRKLIRVIFINPLRILDTQLVNKIFHFRLTLYK